MKFLSLEPFVPSGADFEKARALFMELGFNVTWESPGYAGMERDGCRFILQHYTSREFAENFMVSVKISDADAFWSFVNEQKLAERFGVRINPPVEQPYGREVNLIDRAGVCWHFVE